MRTGKAESDIQYRRNDMTSTGILSVSFGVRRFLSSQQVLPGLGNRLETSFRTVIDENLRFVRRYRYCKHMAEEMTDDDIGSALPHFLDKGFACNGGG